jgi:hypothetical protein
MPYESGTAAAPKLVDEIVAHIETLRSQFPAKRFVSIYAPKGGDRKTGIRVEVYSSADEQSPHRYFSDDGHEILEEYHRVTIDVKADSKGGGAAAAQDVYGTIKRSFGSDVGRAAMIARGAYDVRESADGAQIEGVDFERPLHLTCNTDTYLS